MKDRTSAKTVMEELSELPPPPPPPPDEPKPRQKPRRKSLREVLALFHEEDADAARVKRQWAALWQTTLADAQEEQKRRRQQQQQGTKRRGDGLTPSRLGRHGDHLKRARQGSAASTDSSESGKRAMGRFQKGKLMQRLGTRGT